MNEHPSNFVHLMSDVEVWKHPDRDYFTFVILSILLGFFGVDHIYLRSFPTAIAKTVVNLFTFGLWYIWDVLQIFGDGDRIKKEGLNSPFDWIKGIGRGVFKKPGDYYVAHKDYVLYTILTFFGCLGADKFYLGNYGQGIVKLISCFNIFLFLFGWFWVAWDWYHAVFTMRTVMTEGISSPLPYSFLFDPIKAKDLFEVRTATNLPKELSFTEWFKSWIPSFSFPSFSFPSFLSLPSFSSFFAFLPGIGIFQELFDLFKPLFTIGKAGTTLATSIKQDGEQILGGASSTLQAATDPGKLATLAAQSVPQIPQVPQVPLPPAGGMLPQIPQLPRGTQVGGARPEGSGLGPVLAGSVAALLLAGGAKGLYDFIRRQV
jgi:TM2 domain-containing membrane protein YozV